MLNDEVRRLSRVLEEFNRPFDADPATLQLYKKVDCDAVCLSNTLMIMFVCKHVQLKHSEHLSKNLELSEIKIFVWEREELREMSGKLMLFGKLQKLNLTAWAN